jgi:hypothetical protein
MSGIALGKLEQVDPHLLWVSEPGHFTPWLADNLTTLGEALGLELELIKAESSVGPFACDIEARDINTRRKVIIENQLEPTDHTHLGQLLTYAAGLDATVIVWISPLFREQHRQAIDFLNRHTAEGLDFFAVALEVVKIGNSQPAVVFRLAASPNAWAKTLAATNQPAVTSTRMLAYQEFYQGVIDELRTVHHFTNARAGQPQSWYSFTSGTKGFLYSASFTAKGQLRAELYIDVGDERNKIIFDYFSAMKVQLEQSMGETLTWERLDKRRASRISALRQNTTIEDVATQRTEIQKWVIDHLLRVKKVFGPHLKSALQTASIASQTAAPSPEFSESVPLSEAEPV